MKIYNRNFNYINLILFLYSTLKILFYIFNLKIFNFYYLLFYIRILIL